MKEKNQYPIIDGHRKHFVRYPVLVTEQMAKKNPCALKLTPGKWVAVDVLKKGYSHLISPVQFNTEKECQKACDIHNSYHEFSHEDIVRIISRSMGIKHKTA